MRLVVSSMTGQLVYLFLNIEYIYIEKIDECIWMEEVMHIMCKWTKKHNNESVYDVSARYIYIFEAEWRKHTNEQLFSLCFTFIFVKIFFAWSCDCHTASEKESTCSSVRKWANKLKRKKIRISHWNKFSVEIGKMSTSDKSQN